MFSKRATQAILLLLLSACMKKGDFAPEEVLQRSVRANGELQSVRIRAEAVYESADDTSDDERSETLFNADLRLSDRGQQIQGTYSVQHGKGAGDARITVESGGEAIILLPGDAYVRIEQMAMRVGETPLPGSDAFTALSQQWLHIPLSHSGAQTGMEIDPAMLALQAQIVKVTKEHGLVALDGHDVYHYDVEIDREKLLQYIRSAEDAGALEQRLAELTATGELWIDSESFVLRQARWNLSTGPEGEEGDTLRLMLHMSEHNEEVRIVPPENAMPLPTAGTTPLDLLLPQTDASSSSADEE